MRISLLTGLAIAMVAMTAPRAARAQVDDQFSWGASAGAVIPANELAHDHTTGFNIGGSMAIGGLDQSWGIRIDGMFNRFGAKSGTSAGNAQILAGTLNLVVPFVASDRLYVIGGIGGYGYHPGVKDGTNATDFGVNGGIGMFLPGLNGYIEARYNHFYRALPDKHAAVFVPITFGILF